MIIMAGEKLFRRKWQSILKMQMQTNKQKNGS